MADPRDLDITVRGRASINQPTAGHLFRGRFFFFFERLGPFTQVYSTTTPELRIPGTEFTCGFVPRKLQLRFDQWDHLVPTRLCILFHRKGCIGRHR